MFKRKQTGDEGRNIKPALEDGEKSGFRRNRYERTMVRLLDLFIKGDYTEYCAIFKTSQYLYGLLFI